jgi:ribosomal protein L37AE/L43A
MHKIKEFIRFLVTARGKKCPKCGGTNTDCENNIWYCHDCQHEW